VVVTKEGVDAGPAPGMTSEAMSDVVETLPDLLHEGLELVFVGINPSVFSATMGHYFARKSNRFWPCLSRSVLSARARAALGVPALVAAHDRLLPPHGIGFTDVVKRPTPRASDLGKQEFAAGAALLLAKLERYQPRVACFQGVMGFRPFAAAMGMAGAGIELGMQTMMLGRTRVFVVPSPSAANAHVTPTEQVGWYDRLAREIGDRDS
jgi:double-stranded uracil-DNA glycosylase